MMQVTETAGYAGTKGMLERGLFGFGKKKEPVNQVEENSTAYPEFYTKEEKDALHAYILGNFGDPGDGVLPDGNRQMKIDYMVIDPTEERPYRTVLTRGMGAHRMMVSDEMQGKTAEYCELMILLPPDWEETAAGEGREKTWPLDCLRSLSKFPSVHDTWLGKGHDVSNEEPFASDTELNSLMLICAQDANEENAEVLLPTGRKVAFYLLVPIYEEELQYKLRNNDDDLMDMFDEAGLPYPPVVDRNRPNTCLPD